MEKMFRLILKRGLIIFVIISIASFFCIHSVYDTQAAKLIYVSDAVSDHQKDVDSNHTITFTTPSGVHAPAATITITFDSGFDNSGVTFSDIDLSHGPTTGYETEETLAAAAGVNIWGASFSGNVLTLSPPTNAVANEIAAGHIVIIEIGTNASGGVNAINNPSIEGGYPLAIAGGFGDERTIGLSISNTLVGVTAQVPGIGGGGGDVTPPIIYDVEVINITPYSATVTWKTNENANSDVDYGLTPAYEIGSVFDGAYVIEHSMDLINLTPNTLYNFRIISRDPYGNMAISDGHTFTTLPVYEELLIYNVRAENITDHSADILWETNHDADSRVDYGLTGIYEIGYEDDGTMVITHIIHLDGLLAGTTYYYSVTSSDNLGNTVTSIDHSFTTTTVAVSPANVFDFDAEADVPNLRVILTWQNPSIPDFAGILIKRSTEDYPATPFDGDFVYNGSDEITYDTDVEFGQMYYYSAFAYNTDGDFASGAFDWAILIPEVTIRVKAWPEKRLPRTGNWDTTGGLILQTPGPVITNYLYTVDTVERNGEADVIVNDLPPGIYNAGFKGLSHLKKVLSNQSINPTEGTLLDFTLNETFYLLAGDVHLTKDNYVNGLDISATVMNLYTDNIHADLNQDTDVNGLDLSILVVNLYKWGD